MPENIESTDSKIHLPQSNESSCTKSKSNVFALDSMFSIKNALGNSLSVSDLAFHNQSNMSKTSSFVKPLRRHISTGRPFKQGKKQHIRRAWSKAEFPFALESCEILDESLIMESGCSANEVKRMNCKFIKQGKGIRGNRKCHIV
eukprot:TRINITY_DN2624_c0_g1_i5.p2 TRINITY_DN2624_c0_g1~~TRINITY_DN2624_c0_g1_i5.p2  ORF type:complete len:145 (-),score=14.61 TRINITY_DN2624_c0_g1_i5:75-509(-)